jgi:hypothetical protein
MQLNETQSRIVDEAFSGEASDADALVILSALVSSGAIPASPTNRWNLHPYIWGGELSLREDGVHYSYSQSGAL